MDGGARVGDAGGGTGYAVRGHGAGGEQFQSHGTDAEKTGTRAGAERGVCVVEAPELFRVLVVGLGDAAGHGQWDMLGRLCRGALEILQGSNRE